MRLQDRLDKSIDNDLRTENFYKLRRQLEFRPQLYVFVKGNYEQVVEKLLEEGSEFERERHQRFSKRCQEREFYSNSPKIAKKFGHGKYII